MRDIIATIHWFVTLLLLAVVLLFGWWAYDVYVAVWPHVREVQAIMWRLDQIEKTIKRLNPFGAEAGELKPLDPAELAELKRCLELAEEADEAISERGFSLLQRAIANEQDFSRN